MQPCSRRGWGSTGKGREVLALFWGDRVASSRHGGAKTRKGADSALSEAPGAQRVEPGPQGHARIEPLVVRRYCVNPGSFRELHDLDVGLP